MTFTYDVSSVLIDSESSFCLGSRSRPAMRRRLWRALWMCVMDRTSLLSGAEYVLLLAWLSSRGGL
jgi:hypothetical protein